MRRGLMAKVLREGDEAGVELVPLLGLVESSCGDVGKAHVRGGLMISTVVLPRSPVGRGRSYTS